MVVVVAFFIAFFSVRSRLLFVIGRDTGGRTDEQCDGELVNGVFSARIYNLQIHKTREEVVCTFLGMRRRRLGTRDSRLEASVCMRALEWVYTYVHPFGKVRWIFLPFVQPMRATPRGH
jgi:hypothetical protein